MANWNPGQPPGPPPGGAPPPGGYGPPPGGYGAPLAGYNPYQAPQNMGNPMGGPPAPQIQGSMGLGFCAGFFGGCIGLILVHLIAKGPLTKRGASIGFGVGILVGVIFRVLAAASN